jgi:hypothetical protein
MLDKLGQAAAKLHSSLGEHGIHGGQELLG